MRLVRYGAKGAERPGALDSAGRLRDVSRLIPDLGPASVALPSLDELRAVDVDKLPIVEGTPRFGPCLSDAPNFFCIGLNYASAAAAIGAPAPREPVVFSKATSALSGPEDPIELPPGSDRTDYEVELGVVVGREATRISEDAALAHVAGYCLVNDVSERHFQGERNGQWIKGKSAPSFGPIGPWLVTADEIENPQSLSLWLRLNGELRQQGDTSDMIFGVAELVSYLSWFMTLRVGDVIATGTPPGSALGRDPARFLVEGDALTLGGDGLGEQRQAVVAAPAAR